AHLRRGGVVHDFGNRERVQASGLLRIEVETFAVESADASHARTHDHAEVGALLVADFDPARLHGLSRRQQSELGEPVQQIEPLEREIVRGLVVRDLGADLHAQRGRIKLSDTADGRAGVHKVGEKAFHVLARRGKDSHAGDDNSPHALLPEGLDEDQPPAACVPPLARATRSETSLPSSTRVRLSTACRTLLMFCATASGMSILNSDSRAKMMLTASRESIPSSANVESSLTTPGWRCCSRAMMSITC